MDRLWYLIKNHWKLKPPTLIISIIGGNSDVKVNMDVKRALEDGLTEVWFRCFSFLHYVASK